MEAGGAVGALGLVGHHVGGQLPAGQSPAGHDAEVRLGQRRLVDGLRAGEQVVVEGQNQLRPGSRVVVRPTKGSP